MADKQNDHIDCLTQDKLTKLTHKMAQWRPSMNDWERKFCTDHIVRFRNHGPYMQMSAKQRNTLSEIVFKFDA